MQVRAIIEAALESRKRGQARCRRRSCIRWSPRARGDGPRQARIAVDGQGGHGESGRKLAYTVGAMIELPRAALRAGEIAETAEFFSFGTNDLTQTTFGISRDDSGRFLGAYIDKGIFERDPFVSLDRTASAS